MIPEITLLRAIGILLVVFGHADIFYQKTPHCYYALEKFVYSFHMPLFIFISGFVFLHINYDKNSFCYSNFIKKKFSRLLAPSFIVLTIAFLLRAILSHSKDTGSDCYSVTNYLKMFFLKSCLPIEFFWFIFTLFGIFLLSKLLLYCIKRKYAILLLTFIFITMNLFPIKVDMFYIIYISQYMIYFWFGLFCCYAASETRQFQILHDRNVALILSILFLMILIAFNMIENTTNVVGLTCSISGILMSYYFVHYIGQFKLEYLKSVGKYSYQIFLLSWFFHRIIETVGFKGFKFGFWVTFPLSFISAIIGPILISKIIEIKLPKMKFVIGLN